MNRSYGYSAIRSYVHDAGNKNREGRKGLFSSLTPYGQREEWQAGVLCPVGTFFFAHYLHVEPLEVIICPLHFGVYNAIVDWTQMLVDGEWGEGELSTYLLVVDGGGGGFVRCEEACRELSSTSTHQGYGRVLYISATQLYLGRLGRKKAPSQVQATNSPTLERKPSKAPLLLWSTGSRSASSSVPVQLCGARRAPRTGRSPPWDCTKPKSHVPETLRIIGVDGPTAHLLALLYTYSVQRCCTCHRMALPLSSYPPQYAGSVRVCLVWQVFRVF